MPAPKSFDHLATALPVTDEAFDAYWENYLRAVPAFTADAKIDLTREQLRVMFKLAFLAGREAQLDEFDVAGVFGIEEAPQKPAAPFHG